MKTTPNIPLTLIITAAFLGVASAQEYTTYATPCYRDPYVSHCSYDSTYSAYERPVRVEVVPTAYSSQMQHYYDSIWAAPTPRPEVIVIHDR
jgi:hypothetical protein